VERAPRSPLTRTETRHCIWSDCGVPPLDGTALHVWTWNLDVDQRRLSRYEDVLSTEEWRRVRRYASHLPARRFIARRGMLRCILGQYLDQPPQDVRFVYNPHGKPFIAPEISTDLHFSLSDSGDLAALGVGIGGPLGIDIERLRPVPLAGGREFHDLPPREAEHFERLAGPERTLAFLGAWTRREATAKAEGVGLQQLSGQVDGDDLADHRGLASYEAGAYRKRGLRLHQLALPEGYVGSLATRRELLEICYCSLD